MTALHCERLSKSFGPIQALREFDLTISTGSFFGLLGPNGAGKSTFMSLVSGFLKADSGTLTLFDQLLDPEDMSQKRQIGFAPQHLALYKELSAEQNLSLFGKLYGLSGKQLSQKINYALEVAQLQDRRKSLVKEFSGGMKRRLNIAAAMLHEPRLLLCDEPTVGVDPQSRNAIFETLLALKENGMTVVYSTHYMEEAERLCDTIAIIDQGSILRIGDLDTLLKELPNVNALRIRREAINPAQRETLAQFGELSEREHALELEAHSGFRLSEFFLWVESQGLESREFQIKRPSLENLFLRLTGRDLRE